MTVSQRDVAAMTAKEAVLELYDEYYFNKRDFRIIGVGSDAYHRIISGQITSSDITAKLRGLLSFYRQLRANGIENFWLEGKLDVPEGYNPSRRRLYKDTDERRTQLLELALHPERTFQLLDVMDPTWRDHRDGFETFLAPDGQMSIRFRNTTQDVILPPPSH